MPLSCMDSAGTNTISENIWVLLALRLVGCSSAPCSYHPGSCLCQLRPSSVKFTVPFSQCLSASVPLTGCCLNLISSWPLESQGPTGIPAESGDCRSKYVSWAPGILARGEVEPGLKPKSVVFLSYPQIYPHIPGAALYLLHSK